jgi:hypothetical protein
MRSLLLLCALCACSPTEATGVSAKPAAQEALLEPERVGHAPSSELARQLEIANGDPTPQQLSVRYTKLTSAQQDAWRKIDRLACNSEMTHDLVRALARQDLLRGLRIYLIERASCSGLQSRELVDELARIAVAKPASDESIGAFRSLAKMGPTGFDSLVWFARQDVARGNRINAIHVLARIPGRGEAVWPLIERLAQHDPDSMVRHYAHSTLRDRHRIANSATR